MNLSEILGWGEKKVCGTCDGTKIIKTIFKDEPCPHCYLIYQWNNALTSCDREIDRYALSRQLSEDVYLFSSKDLADRIISTMPTWLKPTERK